MAILVNVIISAISITDRPIYTPPGEYHFDGDGYVQLDQELYDDEKFGVFLNFKTFWKDSLIFFVGNDDTVSGRPG